MDDLTPSIVTRLRESGERSLTIAPETGSDRLRRVINKTVTNDEILERADVIFASGIENLKLYYMIGPPTETDEDLESIRTLTLQMRERMLVHGKAPRPARTHRRQRQPADPEARHRVPVAADGDVKETDRKILRLRKLMSGIDNVYFTIKSERHSYYQALLSLATAASPRHRRRRAQRRPVARRRRRDRRRRRRRHLPRSPRGRPPALGHHRRRPQAGLLPQRVREVDARRVDRCRRSAPARTRS
jgi:hypothetical protein